MDKFDKFRNDLGDKTVDAIVEKFSLNPDFKYERKRRACPQCGKTNACFKEIHPDTDMNDVVLCCPDCGFVDE